MCTSEATNFNAETVAAANSRLNEMLNFEFLLSLTIWNQILAKIHVSSVSLQKVTTDIEKAKKVLDGLVLWLKDFRISGFESSKIMASEIAETVGIDEASGFENVRSTRERKRIRLSEGAEDTRLTVVQRFEIEFFNALLDHLIMEMGKRFSSLREFYDLFSFLWGKNLVNLSKEELQKHVKDLCSKYEEEFEASAFWNEVDHLRVAISPFLEDEVKLKDTGALDILNVLHKNGLASAYYNVDSALRIFLTLPTTVASNERAFSKLKLIKNYLRASSGQQRTSDLAILSIENAITETVSFEEVITKFSKAKARKVKIF